MVCSYVFRISNQVCSRLKVLIVIHKHKKSVSCWDGVRVELCMKHSV